MSELSDIFRTAKDTNLASAQERLLSREIIQKTRALRAIAGGSDIHIFEVQSSATGDGVYNCYEQTLDATEWTGTDGNPKFDDKDAVSVEVLNLNEYDPAAAQHNLAAGNLLAAWQMTDDEGNERWIGVTVVPWYVCPPE